MINKELLSKYTNAFFVYEIANHGVDPRDTLEGTTLRLKSAEGYKYDDFRKYHARIEKGRPYFDTIINAIPGSNLVDRFHKQRIEGIIAANGLEQFESALCSLYETDDDEHSFSEIVEAIGGSFDVLGFCFFLKDSEKYLPIRSRTFDERLIKLGVESNLEGNCSWEKYNEFIGYVKEIQLFLRKALNKDITLLDAHSFLWVLDKLEGYINSNSQIVIHNQLGKGIVTGFEKDLIVVKFGKTIKKFINDIAFNNGILKYERINTDLYDFGEEKKLEKLLNKREKKIVNVSEAIKESINKEKAKQAARDKDYPEEDKFESSITKESWMEMIKDNDVFRDKDIELLKRFYINDNHASTCYDFSVLDGVHPTSYISPIVSLAQRIAKKQNTGKAVLSDGKAYWWPIIFWGRVREDGLYEWKLQPELAEALSSLFPELDTESINDEEDQKLIEDLKSATLKDVQDGFEYLGERKEKDTPLFVKGRETYPRDRKVALNALSHAYYKCEMDEGHSTFIKRISGKPYTEPHHLVPMSYSYKFEVSLDVEENIVSLCSNCHNEIHYGIDAKRLIERLYYERKEVLKSVGIDISLEELLKMYE